MCVCAWVRLRATKAWGLLWNFLLLILCVCYFLPHAQRHNISTQLSGRGLAVCASRTVTPLWTPHWSSWARRCRTGGGTCAALSPTLRATLTWRCPSSCGVSGKFCTVESCDLWVKMWIQFLYNGQKINPEDQNRNNWIWQTIMENFI